MASKKSQILAGIALIGVSGLTHRAIAEIELRGFGSAGFQKTDSDFFLSDYSTNGKKIQFGSITRVGLNLHAPISNEFEFIGQLLAQKDQQRFPLSMDWGFLAYHPVNNLTIRAGRLINPVWLYSETIDVGFTYPWMQPPSEVYSQNPIKSINGISALFQTSMAQSLFSAEIIGGAENRTVDTGNEKSPSEYQIRMDNTLGFNLALSLDSVVQFRAGYSTADLGLDLTSRTVLVSPALIDVTTSTDVGRAHFISAGMKVEFSDWIASAEYARRIIAGTSFTTANAAYGTLGHTFGRWLPHFTYSWLGQVTGNLNFHPNYPATTTLQKGQHSLIGGLNYRASVNLAVKLQGQRTSYRYQNTSNDFDVWVYGSSVDFLF